MSVKGYKRGVPTYTDANGDKYGMFCETKEACVSDNEGITLEQKLAAINSRLDGMATKQYLADGYLPLTGGNVDSLTINGYEALHTGNSAMIHIGETSPGRIDTVWVDTSE